MAFKFTGNDDGTKKPSALDGDWGRSQKNKKAQQPNSSRTRYRQTNSDCIGPQHEQIGVRDKILQKSVTQVVPPDFFLRKFVATAYCPVGGNY